MKKTATVLLLVLSSIGVAACGGGDGGDEKSATTSSTTTSSTTSTSTSSSTTVATTSTTLTPRGGTVTTTSAAPVGDDPIDRSDIPEMSSMDVEFGQSTMNGTSYSNALILAPRCAGGYLEINAGRTHTRFRGDLSIPDDQLSSSAFRVEVSVDRAAPAFATEVRFGETRPIDIDVTGGLRVRITATPIEPQSSYDCPEAGIGNPRFSK